MMDSSNKNMKLGIFVILITAIFTYVIYKVSGGGGLINNSIVVSAEFDDVKGLLIGNNVRYSGVKVGTVQSIEVVSDTSLLVTMGLEKNVLNFMKNNAQADISTNGLVGNMLVNITPGKTTAPPIKNGDKIQVKQKLDLNQMMNTLSSTNDKITQITDALLQITQKINNGSGSVAQLINDGTLAENLIRTTKNLSVTSNHIKTSTQQINEMVSSVSEGEGNLGYLLKDDSFKTQMNDITNSLDSLINDRAEPIFQNLQVSSATIMNTSKDLEKIISKLDNSEGLLGSVLNDTTITNDLKSSIDNLNKGTQKFDESMEALQHHWLLRGFFKKKKKEEEKKKKK